MSSHVVRSLYSALGGSCAIGLALLLAGPGMSPFLLGSLGASTIILFVLTESPAAQPRALLGGHLSAAFIGIAVAVIGGPAYAVADDWAALAACLVIAFNGVLVFRRAFGEIMDVAASDEVHGRVRGIAPGYAQFWAEPAIGNPTCRCMNAC